MPHMPHCPALPAIDIPAGTAYMHPFRYVADVEAPETDAKGRGKKLQRGRRRSSNIKAESARRARHRAQTKQDMLAMEQAVTIAQQQLRQLHLDNERLK